MTNPTDALRLVPTKATPQQLEAAAFNLSAEIGAAEAMKLGPHIDLAYELLVAAAPASPLPEGGGWQDMTCDEQFALAREIAANIGYVLQPEPDHPDCPHTRQGMAKILRDQLNDKSRRLRPLPAVPTGDA